MSAVTQFQKEVEQNISELGNDDSLKKISNEWMYKSSLHKYTYNFTSLSRPIIQYPQDMVAMQELIWAIKPDLIIETGIAHGGSLILNASVLALLDYSEAVEKGEVLDPKKTRRKVLGIDIDIRQHNRAAIEAHPLAHHIDMIQGSSIDEEIVSKVKAYAKDYRRILVSLDSNHTHSHVLAELEAYAPLVTKDSYCVVFDTGIEDFPDDLYADRPWNSKDNPKTAVWEYLKNHPEFEIDKNIENKLMITVAPDGWLKRIA